MHALLAIVTSRRSYAEIEENPHPSDKRALG